MSRFHQIPLMWSLWLMTKARNRALSIAADVDVSSQNSQRARADVDA